MSLMDNDKFDYLWIEYGIFRGYNENIEFSVLKWFRRDLKLPIHLTADMMPQKGHTETVNADSITVLEVQKKVEQLIKGYGQ